MPHSPPPLVACAGLGRVGASGASGAPLVQLACLLLLQRAVAALWGGEGEPDLAVLCAPLATEGDDGGGGGGGGEGVGATAADAAVAPPLSVHDPLFTPADVALLSALGLRAEAAPAPLLPSAAGSPTLFFLPHCPAAVAGAALAQHDWRCSCGGGSGAGGGGDDGGDASDGSSGDKNDAGSRLQTLRTSCFVGNSFSAYVESRLRGAAPPPPLPPWSAGRRAAALAAAAALGEALPLVGEDAVVGAVAWARGGAGARGCSCRWRLEETCLESPLREHARADSGATALRHALSSTAVCTFTRAR
jgi:hypothetical protein